MSNNIIPFFTTINAKPGVKVTQRLDEDYTGVFDVSIDSDYIVDLIKAMGVFESLTEEQKQNLVRIGEIYSAIGLDRSGNTPPILAPIEDSDTPTIIYSQNNNTLLQNVVVRMLIITNNGDNAVDRTLTIGRGSTRLNVLQNIQRVLFRDSLAVRYINKLHINSQEELSVGWKPTYERFIFRFLVQSSSQEDGVSFSFIRKK